MKQMGKKRTCLSCGKEYEYCPNCGNYSKFPKWMTEFCSEECKDVFNVVSSFNMGLQTSEDVKAVIRKHNITDTTKFAGAIQKVLNDNMTKAVVSDVLEDKVTVEETPVVEEEKAEEVFREEVKLGKKYKPRRRRNVEVDSENNEAISTI